MGEMRWRFRIAVIGYLIADNLRIGSATTESFHWRAFTIESLKGTGISFTIIYARLKRIIMKYLLFIRVILSKSLGKRIAYDL